MSHLTSCTYSRSKKLSCTIRNYWGSRSKRGITHLCLSWFINICLMLQLYNWNCCEWGIAGMSYKTNWKLCANASYETWPQSARWCRCKCIVQKGNFGKVIPLTKLKFQVKSSSMWSRENPSEPWKSATMVFLLSGIYFFDFGYQENSQNSWTICPIIINLGTYPLAVFGNGSTKAFWAWPIGDATNEKSLCLVIDCTDL